MFVSFFFLKKKKIAEEEKSKKYLNSCANGYFEIVLEMFPTVDKSLREVLNFLRSIILET